MRKSDIKKIEKFCKSTKSIGSSLMNKLNSYVNFSITVILFSLFVNA